LEVLLVITTTTGLFPFALMAAILIPDKYVNAQPFKVARITGGTLLLALVFF